MKKYPIKILLPSNQNNLLGKKWWIADGILIPDEYRPYKMHIINNKNYYFQLHKIIHNWCTEQDISYQIDNIINIHEYWYLFFKNIEDAILFKMTWL